jgi:hypothetical protein
MDKILELVPTALALLGGVVSLLAVIAPLTKTLRDDQALGLLQRLMDLVGKLVGAGPKVAPKVKP